MSIVHPQSLWAQLGRIPDPRRAQGQRYALVTILSALLLAALHGKSSLRGMWCWIREHWDQIHVVLGATSPTAPAYGTLWHVVAALEMEPVEAQLQHWIQTVLGRAGARVSADAKTLRGSRRVANQLPGLQILSLVAQQIDVVVRQVQVPADGDLVEALIALVQTVPLTQQVLTVDAGLLHARTTQAVQAQGGAYLGPVKANEPVIKTAIDLYLREALVGPCGPRRPPAVITYDKGHGRQEIRMLWVVPAAELGAYLAREYGWVLRQQRRHREAAWSTDETTIVTSIGPARASPQQILHMLRAHWGIENRSHWVRDVTYQEDRNHARRCGHALASLRNTAIALLRFQGFAYVPDGHAFVSAHLATAVSWLTDKVRYRQN